MAEKLKTLDVIWHEKHSFCMKNSYEPTRVLLTGDARFDLSTDERLKSYWYLGPNNTDTVMGLEIRITITDIPNGVEVY